MIEFSGDRFGNNHSLSDKNGYWINEKGEPINVGYGKHAHFIRYKIEIELKDRLGIDKNQTEIDQAFMILELRHNSDIEYTLEDSIDYLESINAFDAWDKFTKNHFDEIVKNGSDHGFIVWAEKYLDWIKVIDDEFEFYGFGSEKAQTLVNGAKELGYDYDSIIVLNDLSDGETLHVNDLDKVKLRAVRNSNSVQEAVNKTSNVEKRRRGYYERPKY